MAQSDSEDAGRKHRCLFWTDTEDAPGFESEYERDDRVVVCSAEPTAIVRLRSGAVEGHQGGVLWQAGHLPMCDTHATYLQEHAQIKWEILGAHLSPDEVAERERVNYDHVPFEPPDTKDTDS